MNLGLTQIEMIKKLLTKSKYNSLLKPIQKDLTDINLFQKLNLTLKKR